MHNWPHCQSCARIKGLGDESSNFWWQPCSRFSFPTIQRRQMTFFLCRANDFSLPKRRKKWGKRRSVRERGCCHRCKEGLFCEKDIFLFFSGKHCTCGTVNISRSPTVAVAMQANFKKRPETPEKSLSLTSAPSAHSLSSLAVCFSPMSPPPKKEKTRTWGGGVTRKGRSLCFCCFCFAKRGKKCRTCQKKRHHLSEIRTSCRFPADFRARIPTFFPNPILGLENFLPVCLCPSPSPLFRQLTAGEGKKFSHFFLPFSVHKKGTTDKGKKQTRKNNV